MKASYDSKAEEAAAKNIIIAEGYRKAGDYEMIQAPLHDIDGVPFNARLDFIPINAVMCTLEFKTTGMNSKKTISNSAKALEKAEHDFHHYGQGGSLDYIRQKHSWSNSAYKHAEQHAKLPPLSHITVFESWPAFEEIKLYLKLGILFCHISGLNLLNGLCMMARHGISTTYSFSTPDGQQITFPLISMCQHQLQNYIARDPNVPATNMGWHHKTAPKKDWLAAGFQSTRQKRQHVTNREKLSDDNTNDSWIAN